MFHSRYALLSIVTLASSGCLVSEEPLVGETESVTPIAAGAYVSVGSQTEDEFAITHIGTTTRATDAHDPDHTEDLRFAALGDEYYIAMSRFGRDIYVYRLMRNEGAGFTLYGQDDDECDRLRELWLSDGKTPAEVGIVSISGDSHSDCKFARYDDLAHAFRALIDNGGPGRGAVYARK